MEANTRGGQTGAKATEGQGGRAGYHRCPNGKIPLIASTKATAIHVGWRNYTSTERGGAHDERWGKPHQIRRYGHPQVAVRQTGPHRATARATSQPVVVWEPSRSSPSTSKQLRQNNHRISFQQRHFVEEVGSDVEWTGSRAIPRRLVGCQQARCHYSNTGAYDFHRKSRRTRRQCRQRGRLPEQSPGGWLAASRHGVTGMTLPRHRCV